MDQKPRNRSGESLWDRPVRRTTPRGTHRSKPFAGRQSVARRIQEFWRERVEFSLRGMDRPFLYVLLILVFFGMVMIISSGSYAAVRLGGTGVTRYLVKQGGFLLGSLLILFVFSSIDYHVLNWRLLLFAFPFVLVLNIVPIFFQDANGAHRWIDLGPLSFQPSELAKFYLVALAAALLSLPKTKKRAAQRNRFFILTLALFAFVLIIAVLQSNLSTAAIAGMSTMMVLLTSSLPVVWSILLGGAGMVGGIFMFIYSSYRQDRLKGFMNPMADPTGKNLQIVQSLYALSMGGLLGQGLGNSRFKAFWLPMAENDFIFAIICEELGLVGALGVIGLLGYLVLAGFRIGRTAKDEHGKLLALGILSVIFFQSAINLAVVMGAFPVTGVTLPFISAGGTSLFVNMAAMGIVLNVSKQRKEAV
ncbi:Cell division protein FtsW [Clostridiaceae bacterium JG1575]|nr:Cell division protein FtsW [Clostridiaceae bacterium JG1575]